MRSAHCVTLIVHWKSAQGTRPPAGATKSASATTTASKSGARLQHASGNGGASSRRTRGWS
eukprot:830765-Prorocentrum_lima.AAC.1